MTWKSEILAVMQPEVKLVVERVSGARNLIELKVTLDKEKTWNTAQHLGI